MRRKMRDRKQLKKDHIKEKTATYERKKLHTPTTLTNIECSKAPSKLLTMVKYE